MITLIPGCHLFESTPAGGIVDTVSGSKWRFLRFVPTRGEGEYHSVAGGRVWWPRLRVEFVLADMPKEFE